MARPFAAGAQHQAKPVPTNDATIRQVAVLDGIKLDTSSPANAAVSRL